MSNCRRISYRFSLLDRKGIEYRLRRIIMTKYLIQLLILSSVLFLSVGDLARQAQCKGLRDRLEGLVYEVEEWSTPRDGWLKDQTSPDKWKLWTTEKNAWNARSGGQALRSPDVQEDRKSPEEGAPVLHTKITGIPVGIYKVFCGKTVRPLAFSFDKGTTWVKGKNRGEEFFGVFDIQDGTFEVWVDDRFAAEKPEQRGGSYYDYIRFVPGEFPSISRLKDFTLPNGDTQLSWITSIPSLAAVVKFGTSSEADTQEIREEEDGLRNHSVVLSGLQKGQQYKAQVTIPMNWAHTGRTEKILFTAGSEPVPGPTQKSRIRLRVDEPSGVGRKAWPVTSGVPFGKGVLANVRDIRLVDARGDRVPAQFETFCKWTDGSIKWLVCDFLADTQPEKSSFYYLETEATESRNDCAAPDWEKYRSILKKISSKIVLADGTELVARAGDFVPENVGAIRVTFNGQGSYHDRTNQARFRWGARVSFFGEDHMQIRWTIGNDQLEEPMTLVRSATVRFDEPQGKRPVLSNGKKMQYPFSVVQLDEKKAVCRMNDKTSETGAFDGFVQSESGTWTVANCRETWPKGVFVDTDHIEFSILPELEPNYFPDEAKNSVGYLIKYYWLKDGCYLYKRGMEIRQDFWFSRLSSGSPDENARWSSQGLFAVADPEYYCASGAFPPVFPAQSGVFDIYEKAFETSFAELESGRITRGEFGWMNFGDWFGERTWNWGDNEYDLSYVCALHFIRTGNTAYLKRGTEMAVHYATIDFKAYPWDKKMRELMYRHCAGHVNGFFDETDRRTAPLLKDPEWKAESDGGGGHAYQPGNYYIGCLTGDKRLCDVARIASWNQAKRYTPKYNFGIERAAGWALNNAVYSYNFTRNPYFLNAAEIYFAKILEKQNRDTGCFDMRQNQRECDCPDKANHKGGKAFAVGILLHSLIRYNEVQPSKDIEDVIVRSANWLLDESWNEKAKGFRYKTGCAKYADTGWYTNLVTEGIGFAGQVTGNPRYIQFLKRTLGEEIAKTSGSGRGSGKKFSQMYRQMPHTFYYMQKAGITNAD